MTFVKDPLNATNPREIIEYSQDLEDRIEESFEDIADYVIETDSNSNGSWEKWNSGKLVQWGRKTGGAGAYDTSSGGGVYRTELVNADFPISFSNNDPTVYMNMVATSGLNGWQMLVGQPNSTVTGNICLQRYGSDANGVTYLLSWHAIGRWK